MTVFGRPAHRAATKLDCFDIATPKAPMEAQNPHSPATAVEPMAVRVAMMDLSH